MAQSGLSSFALRFGRRLQQIFQFGHEFLHVFEVEIDRGEPYVSDLIVAAQTVHDELADFAGFALPFGGLDDEGLRFIDDLLELADGHRTFFASAHEAVEHFLAVKTFAAAVFFHHHVGDFVDALVGGKALVATLALATPANGVCFFAFTRIDDSILRETAIGAFHQ